MDALTARARIETMTAWTQEPVLTTEEVDALVVVGARMDRTGLSPDDAAWTPTYELSAAAAEGWRWKAGKVAGIFDFVSDGQRFDRSQQHAMCLQMADHYRKRILVSAAIRSGQPIIAPPILLIAVEEGYLP